MLQSILVRGEVSNCKYHSSGHIYFTLKDAKGTMACVMFAGNRSGLNFRMQEGQQVIVSGSVDVYERDGKYQLYAKNILQDGVGLLHERYEQLKSELAERGMFAPEYKQPIPKYIKRLGVVTAPTGAAVRDIINITARRNPYVQILLYPAIVQGEKAAASVSAGIRALEKQQVDAIIVGRGGGSMEDLWAFNEEEVAQAVFDCSVPIISAVGHETDTTIVDFVADLRAPTPSAAAELAVYEYAQLEEKLAEYRLFLTRQMDRKLVLQKNRAQHLKVQLKLLSPGSKIREKRTYLLKLEENLQDGIQRKLRLNRHRLDIDTERLKGLSPLDKLQQGFSYVSDENGKNVRKAAQVNPGDVIRIQVTDGSILAKVIRTE